MQDGRDFWCSLLLTALEFGLRDLSSCGLETFKDGTWSNPSTKSLPNPPLLRKKHPLASASVSVDGLRPLERVSLEQSSS